MKEVEKRKERLDWTDENVRKLIRLVKPHPAIWDPGNPNFGIRRPALWKEIAEKLKVENWQDVKGKWHSLRGTYKRRKRLEMHGTRSERAWRFKKLMRFVDKTIHRQSNNIPSNGSLEILRSDSEDESHIPQVEASCSASQETHESSPQSQSLITSSNGVNSSAQVQSNCPRVAKNTFNQSDKHWAFGNHIAAELRGLSPRKAKLLKLHLSRVMLDFWEKDDEVPPIPTPFVEIHDINITMKRERNNSTA